MKTKLQPHQTAILAAVIVSLLAYALPIVHLGLLPLQYLNTHFHELSHALMAIGTGGEVQSIRVFADGSGVTPIFGGSMVLVSSAGYVGAALLGAAVIYFGRTPDRARIVLRFLAVLLGISMLLWVRGDTVGVVSGFAWVLALAALSALDGSAVLFVAQLIGIQQCLNAVRSLYTLLQVSAFTEGPSDAMNMARYTHLPAFFWAFAWCGLSLVLVALTVRKAWRESAPPAAKPG